MAEKLADILAHSSSIDDLTDLKYAVFDEDCAGGEALDALGKLFVKVAAAGRSTTRRRPAFVGWRQRNA